MSIKINPQALKNHITSNGITMTEASIKMGRSPGFLSNVIRIGSVSESGYTALCNAFGVEKSAFLPSTVTPPVVTPDAASVYRLNLVYSDSKVLVQLMSGDEVVSGAWAIIKEQSLLGFIQAISYAAHMMYKFAEQDGLNKEELA